MTKSYYKLDESPECSLDHRVYTPLLRRKHVFLFIARMGRLWSLKIEEKCDFSPARFRFDTAENEPSEVAQ